MLPVIPLFKSLIEICSNVGGRLSMDPVTFEFSPILNIVILRGSKLIDPVWPVAPKSLNSIIPGGKYDSCGVPKLP